MRNDVEGEACPFCFPATERLDIDSRVVVELLHGSRSARPSRIASLAVPFREDTSLAHELLAFAIDEGVPEATWRSMIAAHRRRGGNLSCVEALLPLAWNLGLDVERTSAVLVSRRYRRVGLGARTSGGCRFSSSGPKPNFGPVLPRCAGGAHS